MSTFFNKLLELEEKYIKLAEENISLESNLRIMNVTLDINA